MRAVGASPVRHPGRGEDGLLQLYRRLVQPRSAALRVGLPLADGIRSDEGDRHYGTVINIAIEHSTETRQLQLLSRDVPPKAAEPVGLFDKPSDTPTTGGRTCSLGIN